MSGPRWISGDTGGVGETSPSSKGSVSSSDITGDDSGVGATDGNMIAGSEDDDVTDTSMMEGSEELSVSDERIIGCESDDISVTINVEQSK